MKGVPNPKKLARAKKREERLNKKFSEEGSPDLATRRSNRKEIQQELVEVKTLLAPYGIEVRICTTFHWQMRHRNERWIINVWPGPRKIWVDERSMLLLPTFEVEENWTLKDLALATISAYEFNMSLDAAFDSTKPIEPPAPVSEIEQMRRDYRRSTHEPYALQ